MKTQELKQIINEVFKEYIQVYRIENDLGQGPFRDEIAKLIKKQNSDDFIKYKNLYKAITKKYPPQIIGLDSKYVFGFKSIFQLKSWFTNDDLNFLNKYGFKINKYNTNKYYNIMDREIII